METSGEAGQTMGSRSSLKFEQKYWNFYVDGLFCNLKNIYSTFPSFEVCMDVLAFLNSAHDFFSTPSKFIDNNVWP